MKNTLAYCELITAVNSFSCLHTNAQKLLEITDASKISHLPRVRKFSIPPSSSSPVYCVSGSFQSRLSLFLQWRNILYKHNARWLRVPWLKARVVYSFQKTYSVNKTRQLKPGPWWLMEPHWCRWKCQWPGISCSVCVHLLLFFWKKKAVLVFWY